MDVGRLPQVAGRWLRAHPAVAVAAGGAAVAGGLVAHRSRSTHLVLEFSEQADLSEVASMPRGADRREAAWAKLRETAERSQAPVTGVIADLQGRGWIRNAQSLPLGNILVVEVSAHRRKNVENALSAAGAPMTIHRDRDRHIGYRIAALVSAPLLAMNMEMPGFGHNWGTEHISASEAHRQGITGAGIRIGVVDSGIDPTHPAFVSDDGSSRIDSWFDAFGDWESPRDGHGHGTHVAATAAGSGTNVGVAPDADLMVARTFRERGRYSMGSWETWPMLASLDRLLAPDERAGLRDARQGADIINVSAGVSEAALAPLMARQVAELAAAGVVVVLSAGNRGPLPDTVKAPASSPAALTVAATDRTDAVASFSSRAGVSAPGKPDVAAPGYGIVQASPGDIRSAYMSGTSMAAPHVAGAAALILQANPDLDPAEVKRILAATAVDIEIPGPDQKSGAGRIDVDAAVRMAQALVRR